MMEERPLSKMEACLGLSLLAGLLAVLVGVYVYRYDQPPPVVPLDPQWSSAQSAAAATPLASETSDRPEWLSPQNLPLPQAVVR